MRHPLLLALALTAASAPAQWQILDAHTTADLRGIDNIGKGVVWASGTNGTILRSEDDGYMWQGCTIPPGAEHLDFRGIQAFDNNTAIVMSSGKGDLSRLYKTIDGCQTWKLLFTNPDKDGFWDALVMTDGNIGMLIGDPISSSSLVKGAIPGSPIFPTYHTIDGGSTWSRNDHERLVANAAREGTARESIFAASNSSFLLLPYSELFVTGGLAAALHYEQYTFEHVPGLCPDESKCVVDQQADSQMAKGDSAGGFSITANWSLGSFSSSPELRSRPSTAEPHMVVIVGGDYKMPEKPSGTASSCLPTQHGVLMQFVCSAAHTPPHGYRSAVAYDAPTKTWITVGPNGTDLSTDDGHNWHPLKPDPKSGDQPDADQHWNALSLPYAVGPHGRIGLLRPDALSPRP